MGYKNPKNIHNSFGNFNKKLKVSSHNEMPYDKMSKGNSNMVRYIEPDWMIKSLKFFEFESLLTTFNIKLASKRKFKNSTFQHPRDK